MAWVWAVLLPLPASPAEPVERPLHNGDVVKMVQSQFDDETLLTVIDSHPSAFDVSPDALVALKGAGVSERVIRAMIQAGRRGTEAAPAGGPQRPGALAAGMPPGMPPQAMAAMAAMGMGGSLAEMPQFALLVGEKRRALAAATAQVAQSSMEGMQSHSTTANVLLALAQQGLQFVSISAGPAAMMARPVASSMLSHALMAPARRPPTMTVVWALPEKSSVNEASGSAPQFEADWTNIPGVEASVYEPVIVKLVSTPDNWRIVGASHDQMGMAMMMAPSGELTEDRVACIVQRKSPGAAVIRPAAPLAPGEYGLVLRPPKKYHATGTGVLAARQLFYTVWDFRVP